MPKRKTVSIPEETKPLKPKRVSSRSPQFQSKESDIEPSSHDLAVYDARKRGGSCRFVAEAFGISVGEVINCSKRVDEYLCVIHMNSIRLTRRNQIERLDYLYEQAMKGWDLSLKVAETIEIAETKDGTFTKKTRRVQPDNSFIGTAVRILEDQRKIEAIDKNPKVLDPSEAGNEYRVAGKSRELVIHERIQRLQAALTVSVTVEEKVTQAVVSDG